MRSSFVPKSQPWSQPKISEISALEVYYFKVNTKRESLFFTKLEVVNFQGRNPTFIFLENSFRHKLLLRFTDLYYMYTCYNFKVLFTIFAWNIHWKWLWEPILDIWSFEWQAPIKSAITYYLPTSYHSWQEEPSLGF